MSPSQSGRPYFRFFISHDGNFRNIRKAKKVDPGDIFLTDGQMYFVESAPYKEYINAVKGQDKSQKRVRPECDNHKAAVDKFARWGGLDVTGIGACTCARHSLFLPAGTVDFQKGESFANVDYAIASASTAMLVHGILLLAVTYDIFCHWFPGFSRRVKELPPSISFDVEKTEMNGGLARWHAAGHEESCRVRYSLNYMPFVGRIDGEGCEHAWAPVNETAGSTSEKSPGGRGDSINFTVDDLNFGKVTQTTSYNVNKFSEAKKMYIVQLAVFEDLDASLPPVQTGLWRQASTQPERINGKWTSVYFGKNDWGKSVDEVLRQSDDTPAEGGPLTSDENHTPNHEDPAEPVPKKRNSLVRWISVAIELENTMDKLRIDSSLLRPNSTPQKHNSVNNWRKLLLTRLTAYRQDRESFMSSLGEPDHQDRSPPKCADPEYSELGLPSSYQSPTLIAEGCLEPARTEAKLRRAACDDALTTNLTGERATTRAEALLKELREKAETARRRYNRSCDALLRLDLLGSDHRTYLRLDSEHLMLLSDYLENESAAVGQGSRSIAWIWRSDAVNNDENWMIDGKSFHLNKGETYIIFLALKVEWFRARQRARQWEEELMIIKRELVMTLNSFQHEQRKWTERSKQPGLAMGMSEYALKKAKFYEQLAYEAWSRGNPLVSNARGLKHISPFKPEDWPAPWKGFEHILCGSLGHAHGFEEWSGPEVGRVVKWTISRMGGASPQKGADEVPAQSTKKRARPVPRKVPTASEDSDSDRLFGLVSAKRKRNAPKQPVWRLAICTILDNPPYGLKVRPQWKMVVRYRAMRKLVRFTRIRHVRVRPVCYLKSGTEVLPCTVVKSIMLPYRTHTGV
ncbi:hypothetical protein RhiJN_15064 [Ceratobasidium sp. AG-Ba]|nr:hypothetical protein RhiJN_15064 [Ceratobasidium sp. AG-Ba]